MSVKSLQWRWLLVNASVMQNVLMISSVMYVIRETAIPIISEVAC
jgi:hypothetical protein